MKDNQWHVAEIRKLQADIKYKLNFCDDLGTDTWLYADLDPSNHGRSSKVWVVLVPNIDKDNNNKRKEIYSREILSFY